VHAQLLGASGAFCDAIMLASATVWSMQLEWRVTMWECRLGLPLCCQGTMQHSSTTLLQRRSRSEQYAGWQNWSRRSGTSTTRSQLSTASDGFVTRLLPWNGLTSCQLVPARASSCQLVPARASSCQLLPAPADLLPTSSAPASSCGPAELLSAQRTLSKTDDEIF
jgi:hypothetical protein